MGIATVGVIGTGTMGVGIAQVALEAGHAVRWTDADPRAAGRAAERVRDGLMRRAASAGSNPTSAWRGRTSAWRASRRQPTRARSRASRTSSSRPSSRTLVAKRSLFGDLDDASRPDAILATNTSALSVAAIAAATTRPARVIGLHFFNPAPLMPLVEVVAPPSADPGAIAAATALMTAWGKTPVRCADSPGFIVNRVHRPFTLEALALVHDGAATIARVDALIRADGFPMGPFELMDLVGIDVNLAAATAIFLAVYDEGRGGWLAERFRPSPIQERMVAAGHLGRKLSGGFYRYDGSGRAVGPAPLWDLAEDPARSLDDDEIVERITLAIVNEAYRAAGDGVASEDDIDRALRLGAGHPVGPFERTALFGGPAVILERLRRYARVGPRFDPAPALLAAAGQRT